MKQTGIIALLLAVATVGTAQEDMARLEESLKTVLVSKQLVLRTPYGMDNVALDGSGTCIQGCELGSWVGDGSLVVRKIDLTVNALVITADRLLVYYDESNQRKAVITSNPIRLHASLDQGPSDRALQELLTKIFRGVNDPFPSSPPPDLNGSYGSFEWKAKGDDFQVREKGTSQWKKPQDLNMPIEMGEVSEGEKLYIASKTLRPRALKTVDPRYPEEEGKARHNGTVALLAVINRTGSLQAVRIRRATYPDFVAPAVLAISRWKFAAATRDGQPVACAINIEMSFRVQY